MSDNIEVRDEIARMTGWTKTPEPCPIGTEWSEPTARGTPGGRTWCIHPIPNTLDEAAKLPEGWRHRVEEQQNMKGDWYWSARGHVGDVQETTGDTLKIAYGSTELEARFALRLAVLKHMAAQETKQ